MIAVEIVSRETEPKICTFDKSEVLIGRKPSNDIVLNERDVSGVHACLKVAGGAVTVVDLGSTNGTFVDGEAIQASLLRGGEVVRVAGFTIRVLGVEAPAGAASVPEIPAPVSAPAPAPPPLLEAPPLAGPPLLGSELPPLVSAPSKAASPASARPAAASLSVTVATPVVPPAPLTARAPARSEPAVAPPPVAVVAAPIAAPTTRSGELPPTPSPPRAVQAGVAEPGQGTSERVQAAAASAASEATQGAVGELLRDPTVARLSARGRGVLRFWRRSGVAETRALASAAALRSEIEALSGHALGVAPLALTLADGSALWAGVVAGEPWVTIERPAAPLVRLSSWVSEGRIDAEVAERLVRALRLGRPLLALARPGVDAAALLLALGAALARPGCLLRQVVEAIALPPEVAVIDLAGPGALPAAIGLARAASPAWIAIDAPIAGAVPAIRRLERAGVAALVAVVAESVEEGGVAASARGWAEGPSIAYAAAIEVGLRDGVSAVLELIELSGDDPDI